MTARQRLPNRRASDDRHNRRQHRGAKRSYAAAPGRSSSANLQLPETPFSVRISGRVLVRGPGYPLSELLVGARSTARASVFYCVQ
jgi:hypothetical protein